jgi:hypothetical protein
MPEERSNPVTGCARKEVELGHILRFSEEMGMVLLAARSGQLPTAAARNPFRDK